MALEFDLIMNRSESLSMFAEELDIWKDAILTYAKLASLIQKNYVIIFLIHMMKVSTIIG